jgi:hypothetical protein
MTEVILSAEPSAAHLDTTFPAARFRRAKVAVGPPNSVSRIRRRLAGGVLQGRTIWLALLSRIGLALSFQTLLAFGLMVGGASTPWRSAADWWLGTFALAELVNIWWLRRLASAEGLRLRDLYNSGRWWRAADLKWLAVGLVVAAPLGFFPSALLAQALWGDPQIAADMTFRAVPIWAAWMMVITFPVIHGLTELPTYFGYVMPRMEALTGRCSISLVVTSAVLAAQHMFLPLLFDGRYLVWRLLMFLPLALWFGWVVHMRPTILPYLVVAHALLDLSLPLLVLQASIL